jgi:hypothetical protein
MADALDDMSCIQHTQKKYEAAIYFLQLRMNMLLGIEGNDRPVEVSCNAALCRTRTAGCLWRCACMRKSRRRSASSSARSKRVCLR